MADALLNQRYKILSQIGAGGMALVLKAQDMSLGRPVAVKVLRETYTGNGEFLSRFLDEARAAANLAHPNIVTVHDFGEDSGRYYMVMEHVEGKNLKDIIRNEGPFNVDRALDYAIQICMGVGYAHRAGLVHCDLKPQNVLVTPDGRVKVTDFGIARALASIHPAEVNEVVWGSPQYFSPEQAAGEAPTPASDVYSIGVMLFEMLTGKLPFQAENPQELSMKHLQEEPPPLSLYNPSLPEALERIVHKVLAKEPSARYRTADQLGHILVSYKDRGAEVTAGRPQAATVKSTAMPTAPAVGRTQPRPAAKPAPQPASEEQYYGEDEEEEGLDWTAILLAGVALLALVGLIPLWLFVLLRYNPGLFGL
ncbi:MAG: serine/threonine protein kinase [Chloroflexi bacterium]|nr:serine/threonine protein kinase [Chloroflexota bacterium]